jgi:hypothetical protein
LLAERHARHLAERAQTLQDACKPMHTDPSTIWVICYQRTTQEPFPSRQPNEFPCGEPQSNEPPEGLLEPAQADQQG